MFELKIYGNNTIKKIPFTKKLLVSEALHRAGLSLSMPCAGNHTCGKCRVYVHGDFSPIEEDERILLERGGMEKNVRLACFVYATGNGSVQTETQEKTAQIRTQGMPCTVAYDGVSPAYGIAVDIGTTTVVSYLYDLPAGTLLNTTCAMNCQQAYGADVISRIEYAGTHSPVQLQTAILQQLDKMFRENLTKACVDSGQIKRIVITGNTTMLHFLTGKDARGIGAAPFIPESLFGYAESAHRLFPLFGEDAELYLPRSISAYVGADITCGILSTKICEEEKIILLVDVGTNGEMALAVNGKLVCCATAAGPAFEGAEICMGMVAVDGAVSHVLIEEGRVSYSTVGGAPATGICGTGMVSCISVMKTIGVLDETGAIVEDGHAYQASIKERDGQLVFVIGDSGVIVTQEDVRNIQLAKSAIAAGIDTMLHDSGITVEQVDVLYLCGGFGSYINPTEAAAIGLLPPTLAERTCIMGNTAGSGAAEMLFSHAQRRAGETLARTAREISLSTSAYFMERYVDNMMFY